MNLSHRVKKAIEEASLEPEAKGFLLQLTESILTEDEPKIAAIVDL